MQAELKSIRKNNTWTLTNLPADRKVVGSKWVYKRKINQDGSTRYKARLVAKGYTQVQGADFHDTYSPVVRFTLLRLLLAFAAKLDLEVEHLDIDTPYLHGERSEDIYLQQPERFVDEERAEKVCKLHKALYGLKQGGREWNRKIDAILTNMNLKRSMFDACVYYYINLMKLL